MKSLDFEKHSFLGVETLKPTSVTQDHCQTRSMGLRLVGPRTWGYSDITLGLSSPNSTFQHFKV